jgi:pyruvate/2-oxoglutarate dehydrogenase complex dihydrolipoamide dehydrogenase (E3) component
MSERGDHFLPREDADAALILQKQMDKDGVKFHFLTAPTKFELIEEAKDGGMPTIRVTMTKNGETLT